MIRALGRRLPGPAGPHTRIRCLCHILNLCVKVCIVSRYSLTITYVLVTQAILQPFTKPKKRKGASETDLTLDTYNQESDDDESSNEADPDDDNSASQAEETDPTPEGESQNDDEDEDEVDPDREASDDA